MDAVGNSSRGMMENQSGSIVSEGPAPTTDADRAAAASEQAAETKSETFGLFQAAAKALVDAQECRDLAKKALQAMERETDADKNKEHRESAESWKSHAQGFEQLWEKLNAQICRSPAQEQVISLAEIKQAIQQQSDAIEKLAQQQREAIEKQSEAICLVASSVAIQVELQPIPPTEAAMSFSWLARAASHYNSNSCMVLASKFKVPCKLPWVIPKNFNGTVYPAVAEHIIPKHEHEAARFYRIDHNNSANSLLLLRHLGQEYQFGNWTAVPTAAGYSDRYVLLQIHVSEDIWHDPIMYKDPHAWNEGGLPSPVQVFERRTWRGITFGELDGHVFEVKPSPFFPALYAKARMAYKKHPSFPNPDDILDRYQLTPRRTAESIQRVKLLLRN